MLHIAVLEHLTGRIFRPGDRLRIGGRDFEVVGYDPATNTASCSTAIDIRGMDVHLTI